ncbi:TonB-dependent receptor [Gilvimarinus sp. F26214L]|uniref:TonB-dependent receptor n=1 Tax=Gilvimarinus sp. DZF01 TaxID=3461371 RepID=UPI004045A12E
MTVKIPTSILPTSSVSLLVLGMAGLSLPVVAQSGDRVLEEIVITSERREVNLQETPISATVLTGDALNQKGVDNIDEIQQVAPSLAINSYNRSTFINIRGVGIAQSAPTSNPGVAYYVDGVLIPHEQFIGQSFYDIGAIEVLRGPQGTLTGQNSTGGAVYVTTPKPELGILGGHVDQTAGSYGWYRTQAGVNLPMGDVAALRVAGIYETRDGWVDNNGPSAGMDPGSSDLGSVRMNLLVQPSEGQSYNVRYEAFDLESGNIAVKNRTDPNTDPYEISYDGRSFLNQKGYRFSVEGRWDLSETTELRALGSTQDGYTNDQTDGDRTSTEIAEGLGGAGRVSWAKTTFETDILELNLLSSGDGPVQWVLGAFYMADDVPLELYRDEQNTHDFLQSDSNIVTEAENTSQSVFGQVDAFVSEKVQLTAGARYSEDEQVYERVILPGPPPPDCFPCTTTQESSETTGRIGLNYFSNADTMWYGTLSKGYKAGGVNLDPRQGFFEPETNNVLEVGVKTTLDEGRLRLNGNLFYSDYDSIQFSSLLALFGPPLPVTQNAASAKSYGAELELTGAYDALSFNFGLGYLNARFDGDVLLNDTNGGGNGWVRDGDDLPFSPELTANAGIQYDLLLGEMLLVPRLQVSYTDEQLATPFAHPETYVESRTITDLKLAAYPSERWMVEAFVSNLFDEEYVASQIQSSSSADGGPIYGAPRQFGLRTKVEF